MAHVTGPGSQPPGSQPYRRRRPFRAVALTLLLLPAVELMAIVLLARATNGWVAVGTVVLTSLLGALVLARQAPRTWRATREALQVERLSQGRMPGVELLDGALVLLGGLLLLVPGVVSDVVGLLCLLPFVRPPLRRLLLAWARRRASVVGVRLRPPRPRDSNVVQGEVLSPQNPAAHQPGTHQPGTHQPGTHQPGTHQPGTSTPRGSGTEAGRSVIEGKIVEGGRDRDHQGRTDPR